VTAQDKEPEKLLNAAIYQEEVNGNIKEAILLYEKIVTDFPESEYRSVVAEALYRNGLANEKLGNLKAKQLYEKVINNYSDQSKIVELADKRLKRILKREMSGEVSEIPEIAVKKLYNEPGFYGSISYGGVYMANVDWLKNQLYISDFDGGEKKYIQNPVEAKAIDVSIWSYDNKKVAYSLMVNDIYQLALYDVKSDVSKILLDPNPGNYAGPLDFTRDGSHLLISRVDTKKMKYQLLNLSSGELINVLEGEDVDYSWESVPTISPDKKFILYNKLAEKKRKIYSYSIETGENFAVVENQFDNWGQRWEKEGKSFIYASNRTGSPSLYRMKIQDGKPVGEPEFVYENINNKYKPFSLSDDGKLAFQSTTPEKNRKIVEFDLNSGEVIRHENLFGENVNSSSNPVWSHDGKKIASMVTSPNRLQIHNIESGTEEYIDLDFRIFGTGWNQWSGDDSEFMVERVNFGGNKRVIIDLKTKSMERIDDVGWYVDFLGKDNLVYIGEQGSVVRKNRKTGEMDTLCRPDESVYTNIRTSPNQKYLAFFERFRIPVVFKDSRRLWVYNVETGEKEMIWECEAKEYFGYNLINWTADSENLFVFFGKDRTVKDGPENDFSPYMINIQTKEKKQFGKTIHSMHNYNAGSFHPKGDKFAYSTYKQITNLWLLENLYSK
ncbi:tetratricopeptide repeat protein, partial [Bacteroidota bacterium]